MAGPTQLGRCGSSMGAECAESAGSAQVRDVVIMLPPTPLQLDWSMRQVTGKLASGRNLVPHRCFAPISRQSYHATATLKEA